MLFVEHSAAIHQLVHMLIVSHEGDSQPQIVPQLQLSFMKAKPNTENLAFTLEKVY